jgi:hypothetical protein
MIEKRRWRWGMATGGRRHNCERKRGPNLARWRRSRDNGTWWYHVEVSPLAVCGSHTWKVRFGSPFPLPNFWEPRGCFLSLPFFSGIGSRLRTPLDHVFKPFLKAVVILGIGSRFCSSDGGNFRLPRQQL